MENKTNAEIANFLEIYNKWRRGDESMPPIYRQPNPKELGKYIDLAIARLRDADRNKVNNYTL